MCPSLAASEVHTAFEQKPDGQPGQRKQTHPHPPHESPVAFFAVLQTSAASRHSLTQYAADTNGDWWQHEQNVSPPPCPCPFSTPRRGRIGQKTPCPVLLLRPGLAKKHVDCYLSYTSHPPPAHRSAVGASRPVGKCYHSGSNPQTTIRYSRYGITL